MKRDFSSMAPTYKKLRGPNPENLCIWINQIIEYAHLQPGDKILDLGCGTGNFTLAFAARGLEVHAIDISKEMLKVARESDHNRIVKWYKGDAVDLPFKDNFFDACFQSMIIMHIENKGKMFEEIHRVLKGEGISLVRMASHDQSKKLDWYKFFPKCLEEDLRLCPDVEDVIRYMKRAGFADIASIKVIERNQTSPMRRYEQVKGKAFSGLRTLQEIEYQKGLAGYKRYIDSLANPQNLEDGELTLLIGTKK